jgi:Zn-dependent protease with chaperone function
MDRHPNLRRLNPFALPSETDARFNLLVAAAIIVIFNMGVTLLTKFFFGAFTSLSASGVGLLGGQQADPMQLLGMLVSLPFCSGSLIVLLVGFALVQYRRHPEKLRVSRRLLPADPQKDARLLQAVNKLALESGTPAPGVFLGPAEAMDGQAFGLPGKPMLRLGAKISRLRIGAPAQFRALVLHELAHIHNRDIPRAYFADAIWRVFLVLIFPLAGLIVLGYGITYIQSDPPTDLTGWLLSLFFAGVVVVLNALFQAVLVGILLVFIALIRRGALRVRETYADWRAAQWGAADGLKEILVNNSRQPDPGWWKRMRRFHPTPQERLQSLQEPGRFFQIQLDLPVSVGFLLGFVVAGGTPILGAALDLWRLAFASGGASSLTGGLALILVPLTLLVFAAMTLAAAGFVSGTLGLQIQREAAAALVEDRAGWRSYLSLWKPALVTAVLFDVGVWAMPYDTITVAPIPTAEKLLAFGLLPFWIVLLGVTFWGWMGFQRWFALRLLEMHTGNQAPKNQMRLINVCATLLLPVLCIPAAISRAMLVGYLNDPLPFALSLFIVPVLFLAFAALVMLGLKSYRRSHPPTCPVCSQPALTLPAAGQTCTGCGAELAPWLLAG